MPATVPAFADSAPKPGSTPGDAEKLVLCLFRLRRLCERPRSSAALCSQRLASSASRSASFFLLLFSFSSSATYTSQGSMYCSTYSVGPPGTAHLDLGGYPVASYRSQFVKGYCAQTSMNLFFFGLFELFSCSLCSRPPRPKAKGEGSPATPRAGAGCSHFRRRRIWGMQLACMTCTRLVPKEGESSTASHPFIASSPASKAINHLAPVQEPLAPRPLPLALQPCTPADTHILTL